MKTLLGLRGFLCVKMPVSNSVPLEISNGNFNPLLIKVFIINQ